MILKQSDALEFLVAQQTNSVYMTIGSPPYVSKESKYGMVSSNVTEWVNWMLEITKEAVRVTQQDVIWIANGVRKNGEYLPACEGLIWEWHRLGYQQERPAVWYKNSPFNRQNYFSNTWEYILCFREMSTNKRSFWDWEAIAHPPKYKSGGRFRQRDAKGERKLGGEYPKNKLVRPNDVIRATIGGGHMGHPLAHENEAPYPESLVTQLVLPLCPENEIVCDPFLGSGTTAAVCLKNNRKFIGCDIRSSQVELTKKRIGELL